MSAIAAIFRLDGGAVPASSVERVLDRLSHRGGDGKGTWVDGNIGLGHLMRWTTPESMTEFLPARDPEISSVISFDGRIDNRDELLTLLECKASAATLPDSAIVLKSYKKWGRDCAARLEGDFVFAIWDERERSLFAARDPLGVKHFYYVHQPGRLFAVASEIKALFAIPDVGKELNHERIGDYLVANSEDRVQTFYRGVRRLPSTHAMQVTRDKLRTWEYWRPADQEIRLKRDRDYHEMFLDRFSAAVTRRLRSAYPVGSMLSGGLDSSSIVCVASDFLKRRTSKPLHTFSAIFPTIAELDLRIDEQRFMQSVIAKTGCIAHTVTADNESPFVDIERVLWHTDHPVGAPMYLDWQIFKAAEKVGVKTVLSGFDGDSTVSHGYEDLTSFALKGRYLHLLRESLALSRNMPRPSHSLHRLFWRKGILKSVPPSALSLWRKLRGRVPADVAPGLAFPLHFDAVRESFRQAYDLKGRIARLRSENYPEHISPIEYHWRALRNGHFTEVLENLEKASAAFGIEARFPFFDRKLIEFCIALPPGQRIYRGWTRSIFRHAMQGIVPDDVLWRTDKSNIGASFKVNMLKYGEEQLERLFSLDAEILREYVDVERLRSAYRKYRSSPMDSDPEALLLMTNVYLLNWFEQGRSGDGNVIRRALSGPAVAA